MFDYIYNWQNNEKRKTLKGRRCRILKRGSKNSVEVEFENGQKEIVSGYSLKKNKTMKKLLLLFTLLIFSAGIFGQNLSTEKKAAIKAVKIDSQKTKPTSMQGGQINTIISIVDTAAVTIAKIDTAAIAKFNIPDSVKKDINKTVIAASELAKQSETLKITLNEEKGKTSFYQKLQAILLWLIGIITLFSALAKSIAGLSAWFDLIHKFNQLITWIVKLFNKKGIVMKKDGKKGTYQQVFIPDGSKIEIVQDKICGVNLKWQIVSDSTDLSNVMSAEDCRFIGTKEECENFILKNKSV